MERVANGGAGAHHVRLALALAALVPLWALAASGSPDAWELTWTNVFNAAPAAVAVLLWPVMQLGTLGATAVMTVLARFIGGTWRAAAVLMSGVGAWLAAKVVKAIVERPRPLEYLPQLDVREGSGTGLGFASGHAALAFALAAALAPALPRRWRAVAWVLAVVVGLARVVYGVHLPLDVVGGAAVGLAVASAVQVVIDAASRRRPPVARA